jgi:hypothetical protein
MEVDDELLSEVTEELHCKKDLRNSDVDNGGANQTRWWSENSYSQVVWFCATFVNIGI